MIVVSHQTCLGRNFSSCACPVTDTPTPSLCHFVHTAFNNNNAGPFHKTQYHSRPSFNFERQYDTIATHHPSPQLPVKYTYRIVVHRISDKSKQDPHRRAPPTYYLNK